MKKAFVYTELQFSIPFDNVPWEEINPNLLKVKGLVRKTWLSGVSSNSVGGFYEFDSIENAQDFAWNVFPQEARNFGVSFMTKIFDGAITETASKGMNSPYYND
ncbi:YdhR family protein [Fulvivirga ligni]|uniref:YdhR family protein n=1 Tax=Fulvivirga ligni TaxID=2904246 RepID=UPI001F442069|nr:YdhR family protein [Fulvivirga ligni]UII24286.1 YdhR family protein [Fulvivirga ligni]